MSGNYRSKSGYSGYARQRSHMDNNGPRKPGGGRRTSLGAVLAVIVILAVAAIGTYYLVNGNGTAAAGTGQTAAPNNQQMGTDKYYDGVFVDGINLGGLTREEAKSKIEDKQKAAVKSTGVTIVYNANTNWHFNLSDLPAGTYSFNTDAVLDQAWNVGRDQATKADNQAYVKQLPQNPVKLVTKATVTDPSSLEQKVRGLATPYYKAAVNAAYTGYDNTKPAGIGRLQFTPDQPGSQVDADALWTAVKAEFTNGTFGTVQMQVTPVPADVTQAEIQADMQLIGTYETNIINSAAPRLTNINLGNKACSGKFLMPGDTFSVNDSTGPRTAAAGYMKAPVDANGIDDVGLGGGMCQVSGTLYNAAIAAGPNNIQIVERNHHSLPSYYMGKGYDATVDYGSKDLKFMNVSNKPILIIVYYDYDKSRKYDYHEHAEIYGPADPEGATYSLDCKVTSTIAPKTGYRTVVSAALQPGETKHYDAHQGYVVARYLKKTAKDGTVTETRILPDDTYPADMEVYAYYKDDTPPTPTPTPTPTPSDTPTPPPTSTPTPKPTTTEG